MAPREQQGEIGPLYRAWGTLMLQSFQQEDKTSYQLIKQSVIRKKNKLERDEQGLLFVPINIEKKRYQIEGKQYFYSEELDLEKECQCRASLENRAKKI